LKLTPRDRLCVVGKTGMGKSNYAKALCAEQMELGNRVVVFDVCDEYSGEGRATEHVKLGPLTQRCSVDELILDPKSWLDRKDLALAVVPEGDPEVIARDFEHASELIRHTGNLVFVVEEVGYFGEHCQERLKAVATMYRHHGIVAVFCAQRAVQIPLTARSQASQIVAFRQDEPADLQALDARINEDFAEQVSRLRPGDHVVWRDDLTDNHNPKGKKQ
jgi:hypothetical protein